MKKILAFIMCAALMLALTACSGNSADTADTALAATEPVQAADAAVGTAAVQETPAAAADPVEVALLDSYAFEDDGEAFTFLALALKAPEKSSWSLRTRDGELIDTWISSYPNKTVVSATEDERHVILLFNELAGAYDPADLALSVTYTVAGGTETTDMFGDWGAAVAAEARGEYGVHDFGGYIGFASQATAFGDENKVGVELVMTAIPFGGNSEKTPYTNAAEQFRFFAKDGTDLADALGYSRYEITNNGIWVTLKFNVQDGEPSGESAADALKETIGYMEYTRDDGEVIRIDIQL